MLRLGLKGPLAEDQFAFWQRHFYRSPLEEEFVRERSLLRNSPKWPPVEDLQGLSPEDPGNRAGFLERDERR